MPVTGIAANSSAKQNSLSFQWRKKDEIMGCTHDYNIYLENKKARLNECDFRNFDNFFSKNNSIIQYVFIRAEIYNYELIFL